MTIYDIAKLLNVSYGTVSMALNGNPKIAEKTRRRIQEFAAQHGFTTNKGARNLRLKKSSLVAVIVIDIASDFWAGVIGAIEGTLGVDYNLIVCNSEGSVEKEQRIVSNLLALRVGGVIVQPADNRCVTHLSTLHQAGMPVILFERTAASELAYVKGNDLEAARTAVEYLVNHGHRRIAMLSNGLSHISGLSDRERGFQEATMDANIADTCRIIKIDYTEEQNLQTMSVEEVKSFSAIICIDDVFVIPFLKMLRRENLNCPKDISLLSWRNKVVLDMMMPPVAHFEIPVKEMGRLAAEYIMQRQQRDYPAIQQLIDEPLIAGESIHSAYSKIDDRHKLKGDIGYDTENTN